MSGRLGAQDLAATTNTTVYGPVAASTVTTLNVSLCNRNSSTVKVRLAVASSATPGVAEWVEYDATLAPNGVLERTGLVLQTGYYLVAYSDTANVSVVATGFEEAA